MKEERHQPLIVAKNECDFKYLRDKVNQLPDNILIQIEKVESGLVGIVCFLRKTWRDDNKTILPNDVRQITVFDEYIGIYSEDFFFRIPYKKGDEHPSYIFTQLPKPPTEKETK